MKYLFLLLLSLSLKAELDLTIPEQPAAYIPPEKEFYLHLGDYNEPPTKAQVITFWTLNALDIYTTYEGLKEPNTKESNFLIGKDPHLDEMLIQKVIIGTLLYKNSSKKYMRLVNVGLTYAVVNNYGYMK